MISFIKKSAALVLAAWILFSCESPIQAGLGGRVDITGPEITVLDPEAGDYLNGLVNFSIFADDDIKVENVFVYAALEENFHKESPEWVVINPPENGKIWVWQKNTASEEDGILLARFRAVDNSGKTNDTEILSYTIKNLPPRIDLNIPNFSLKDRTQLLGEELTIAKNGLSIDSGGVLIGYATDIQGVRYESPKIKLWREGTPKPSHWADVDIPNWKELDPASSLANSRGREFRYYITNHQELDDLDPTKFKDPRIANPLPVGNYQLQFLVTDTSKGEGISAIFPPTHTIDGVEYDYLKVRVVPSNETPRLDVKFTPNNTYQSESFVIEAKASHSMGIGEIDLLVRKSGETGQHSLAWATNTENLYDQDINGIATKSRSTVSAFVIPGYSYPQTNGANYLFDSGTYEFTIQAVSKAGARFSHTQTIYIDNTRPTVQITLVAPGVYVDPADPNYYSLVHHEQDRSSFLADNAQHIPEAYIVNGKVKINVAPFDQNGLGIQEVDTAGREIRRLRYLLARVKYTAYDLANPTAQTNKLKSILPLNSAGAALDMDLMYDALPGDERTWRSHGDGEWIAGFMDRLLGSSDTGTGISSTAADIITLDTTTAIPSSWSGEGELYLFITAKDKANNLAALLKGTDTIGYHLRVNQGSDKPYVTFTDIKDTVDTPAKLKGVYDNIMESTVRIRGTLEDDDGILVSPASVGFKILKEGDPEIDAKIIPFNAELYNGREGKSLSFNFSRQDLGKAYGITSAPGLPDGVYRLMVYVTDDAGKKDGAPTSNNEPVKPVWFAIDAESPGIEIVGVKNNDFVTEELPMTVNVSDANGPLQLAVRPPQLMYESNIALQYWNLDYLRWISGIAPANWFDAITDNPSQHYYFGTYGADKLSATGMPAAALVTYIQTKVLPDVTTIAVPVTTTANDKTTTQYKFHIKGIDNTATPHLTVGMIAQDRFLKDTTKILSVQLDKEKPHIEITNGNSNIRWFQGIGSISGRVWDPYSSAEITEAAATGAVRQIYYKKIAWTSPSTPPADPGLPAIGSEASAGWFLAAIDFPNEPKAGWSVSVSETDAEGIYTLYLYAVDQAGNRGPEPTVSQKYGLDKHSPTITVKVGNVPTGGTSTAAPEPFNPPYRDFRFDLSGNIADNLGLQTFTITQSKAGVTTPILTPDVPLSPGALSLDWMLSNLPRKADGSTITDWTTANGAYDGTYTYTLTLTDMAGHTPSSTPITQIVNIDTKPPVVKITSHHSSPTLSAFIPTTSMILSGEMIDANPGDVYFWDGPIGASPTSPIPATAAAAELSTEWTKATNNSWTIEYNLPDDAVQGPRHIQIIAFDILGHRNTGISYTDNNGDPYPASPSYDFPYTLDKYDPKLTETAVGSAYGIGNRKKVASSFNLEGVVGDANGVRRITITQSYQGAPTDPAYNFTYEVFNCWNEATSAFVSGGAYLLPGLDHSWDTGHRFTVGGTSVASGFSLPMKNTGTPAMPIHEVKSGEFDYIITATDKFGRESKEYRYVVVDIEPPEVTLKATNKPENSWYDGQNAPKVLGNATDDLTDIDAVFAWYGKGTLSPSYTPPQAPAYDTIDHIMYNPPVPAKTWERVGTTDWTVPLSSILENDFAEGYYTLYVIAVDGAGNIGGKKTGTSPSATYAPLRYDFRVDKEKPTVTETLVDPTINVVYDSASLTGAQKSPLRKGSFDLNVNLKDSYGVYRLEVTQKQTIEIAGNPVATTKTILITSYSSSPTEQAAPFSNLPWNEANAADSDGNRSYSSPMTAVDGIYEYEFTVYDLTYSDPAVRKSGKETRKITVDTTPPKVHILEPGDGYQTLSSQMKISGTSTDAYPGTDREIWYWTGSGTSIIPGNISGIDEFNAANKAAGKWQRADGGIAADWNKPIIALGTQEGYRRVAVVAEDRHGNVSPIECFDTGTNTDHVNIRYFSKDNAPPALREDIIDTRGRVSRSPLFTMGGNTSDSNGVQKIELKQTRVGPEPSLVPETITVTLNLNTNSADKNQIQYWLFKDLPYVSDTGISQTISNPASIGSGTGLSSFTPITLTGTPFADSGTFDYVITVYDVSGRITVEERHVTIDTQPPTVALSTPPVNPAQDSWLAATTILKGNAYDSGGNNSGVDRVYFWYGDPANPPTPATYDTKAHLQAVGSVWTAVSAGTGGAFEITLPISNSTFVEGKYKLLVLALDLAGNIGGTTNISATTAPVPYLFGADKAPPDADELSATLPTQDLYKTALFSLEGTIYDSYGIKDYENVQITQTINGNPPVPIKIYGTNSSNSVANYTETQGHASIPSGRPATTRWWQLTNLPRRPDSVGNPMAPLADGKYTYTISVKDNAGKETTITRVVYVDGNAPVVEITGPSEVVNQKWYDGSSISITGRATDAAPSSGIDAVYIWYSSGDGTGSGAGNPAPSALVVDAAGNITSGSGWAKAGITVDTGNPGLATWNSASYSLSAEGPRTVSVKSRDKAGHMSAAVTKTFWVDDAPPTLLNIPAVTSPRNSNFTLSGNAWDTNGLKSVSIVQKKLGVSGANATVEIFNAAAFTVGSGTGSGLDSSNLAAWTMGTETLPRRQTAAHPYALEDGTYTYTIILTDKSGRITEQTITVLVDTTEPKNISGSTSDITITYPQAAVSEDGVNTWIGGTSLTIRGSARDHNRNLDPTPPEGTLTPSGISKVLFWASHNLSATPAAPGGPTNTGVWQAATYDSSTQEWNQTFNLEDFSLQAGANKLWVRAYDNAGNLSASYTRLFGVDQDDPALTETTVMNDFSLTTHPASYTYARDTFFTLSGKVEETNIDRVVITQHVRNADSSYVNAAPVVIATLKTTGGITGSGTTKDWTLPVNNLPRKFAADGSTVDSTQTLTQTELDVTDKTFIYSIKAYDLAGKESSVVTRTVTIDKTGPTVVITKPIPSASFSESPIQIKGTAVDGNAVHSVYYRITQTPADSSAAATLLEAIAPTVAGKRTYPNSSANSVSTQWSPAEGAEEWSKYVDFSTYFGGGGIEEGALTLWVIGKDIGANFGGSSTTAGNPVRVDFTLDKNLPVIGDITYNTETAYQSITRITRNIYANGNFSFSFDAWDTNVLAAANPVLVKRNGATLSTGVTVTSQLPNPPQTGITAEKNRRVIIRQEVGSSAGQLADDTYTYTIIVTDAAGKTTEKTISIVVDTVKPDLTIGSITPLVTETSGGIETSNVNGFFWFSVNAMDADSNIFPYVMYPTSPTPDLGSDGSEFGGVKYYLALDGVSGHPMASPFTDAGGTVLTKSAYRGLVDSTLLNPGAKYTLHVYARDGAGNIAHTSYINPLTVNQDTDKPVINIPAMGATNETGISGTLNLDPKNGGYPITGFVTDDDNVDGLTNDTKLLFYISQKDPASIPAANWELIPYNNTAGEGRVKKAQSTSNSDKEWNFTYTVPSAYLDGSYLFKVVASDKDKTFPYTQNQTPAVTLNVQAVKTVEPIYRLNVDSRNPEITVTHIENTYKATQTITGTVKEATLKTFKVTLDGSKVYDAFNPDGTVKIGGDLLLSGINETKTWTLNIPAADFNALNDGPHSLLWSAEDAVGNPGSLGKTFYKDSSGPDINFTNINEDQMYIIKGLDTNSESIWYNPKVMNTAAIITKDEESLKLIADVITDGTPKLTGTFSDEFSTVFEIVSGNPVIKFWYRFDAPGASNTDVNPWIEAGTTDYLPNLSDLDGSQKTVRWQIPLSGLGQGYHTVDIKVFDRWGSENGLTVRASANDPTTGKYYPYERVAFRLDSDPPEIILTPKDASNKALVDGDTFGPHSTGQLMFNLLATVKDVTLSEVNARINVGNNTYYTFTNLGTIVDGAVKTLTINKTFTETDMTTLLAAAQAAGETSNIYTVIITAVDGAPRQTIETIQFKMDGAPPRITTSNLVTNRSAATGYPSVLIDAQPTIQGNISDDSGIGVAKYSIAKWDYTANSGAGDWGAGTTHDLSDTVFTSAFVTMEAFTINLGSSGTGALGLTDGKYKISFELKDKASPNPNAAAKINTTVGVPASGDAINNIEFFIDRAAPAMETVNFKSPPFYSGMEVNISSADYMAVYIKASDLNTITTIRGKLESDSNWTYTGALHTDSTAAPGANYRILIPRVSTAEGLHTLTLEATDGAGRTFTTTRDFTLDKSQPMLEVIEPQYPNPDNHTIPAEITSQATIRGITVDNNSVSKLYYLFGRREVTNGTLDAAGPAGTTATVDGKIWREFNAGINKAGNTIAFGSYTAPSAANPDLAQGGGSLYNWTIMLPNSVDLTTDLVSGVGRYVSLRSGSTFLCDLPIKFMMIDSAGNKAIVDYTIIVNPKGDEPMVTFSQPNPAQTALQNEVGGVIQVVGTAKDNDWIHRVVFRVFKSADPATATITDVFTDTGWTSDQATNDAYAALGDNRGGWFQAPILGTPGSNISWSFNLNNNGGLNPVGGSNGRVVTIQALAYDTSPFNHLAAKTMGEIATVQVTFVNGLPFVVNNSTIITPDSKNGRPFFYNTNNQNIGGIFTITTRIRDDNGLKELTYHGEDSTAWSTNIFTITPEVGATTYAKPVTVVPAAGLNPSTYYLVLEGPNRTNLPFLGSSPPAGLISASPALNETGDGPYTYAAGKKGYIEYEVRLEFDSTALKNRDQQLFVNRAGHYVLSILATDHTDFKMPLELTLNIDNFFPLGTYTGNGVAAGTSYQLQGLAWDTGAGVTVQGIKKVVAWFSRGEQFVPLNEKAMGSGAAFKPADGSITVATGRTDANSGVTPAPTMTINTGASWIKFPDLRYTRRYVDNDATLGNEPLYNLSSLNISGIEIDANEPTQDNDLDGFLEGLADAGTNYQWYGRIDTTKFNDGLLTVHYLVYDKAGNASYYNNTIFISNNPPKVTGVDIGTDVLKVGATTDPRGHRTISANYGNTNFTVRNQQLSFKINISGDDGAKPFHYRFGYVTNRVSKSASVLETGKIYSIEAVGTVNWTAVGAPDGYDVGTTFMATDHTSFGTGTALELTITDVRAHNTNAHEISYNYYNGSGADGTRNDFPAIADTTIPNDAWFVLRVYNSLKIPMIPDTGWMMDGGNIDVGPDGTTPVYRDTPYGNPDLRFNIWDQPYDVVRIGLNVANDDTVKPEVKLWDFNPGGEAAGITGATGTAAQPPSSINITPNAALSPNLLKGGLYNPRNNNRNIERSGHIEPRFAAGQNSYFIEGNYGSANFAKDTLSGEVILRGFAYDDQRLGAVYIKIGSDNEFKILQSDDTTPYNPSTPNNRGLLIPMSGQSAFVYNQIDVAGHMAEWAYVWNTATLPANFVAGDNVKVQVRVEDKRSIPNSSVTRLHPNTGEPADGSAILTGSNNGRYPLVLRNADGWRLNLAADMGYNRIAVTLAPYLNSLQRETGKGYNSLRSRQGWYSFSRGETIVAQGWNLKFPGANTTVTLDTDTATVNATVGNQTTTGITFTVPATAVSGNVRLLANGVTTVNERNDNRNPWNREDYNLSISGNDLWKDDRAAHIWHTTGDIGSDRTQIAGSNNPTDPAMTMNPANGVLWSSWSAPSHSAVYMAANNATSSTNVLTNTGGGGMDSTDIYYAYPQRNYPVGSSNPTAYPTVFFNSIRKYNSNFGVTQSGGIKGYDPAGASRFENYGSGENHQYNVELDIHNEITGQFGNPRVVYRGDNMHVTYYDSKDKSLKYWFGRTGYSISSGNYTSNATPSSGNQHGLNAPAQHWINLDGGSDAQDTTGSNRVRPNGAGEAGTNNFPRADNAGPWSAVDVQNTGRPVVAYFDDEHATLRIAYATTDLNPVAAQWNVQYAMQTGDENYSFAGEYVSMQIDQTNNDAHLAFFKSNSTQLIYLKLAWAGGKYVQSYGPSIIIDESSANGKWVDLTLDKQNRPWISYLDISRAGNYDGIKMAYYNPSKYEQGEHSYDVNGIEKTGWETMNVPALYKASDNRTNIEVWPHRDTPSGWTSKPWAAAVGYTNPDYCRIAYYIRPQS
ncbi:hypothetical protein LQZ19_07845 [Treponema primitia]|uniref:hypothetical protein n=1 Tax=Treponema primitia TaxID=88058 RepID=UPI0039813442